MKNRRENVESKKLHLDLLCFNFYKSILRIKNNIANLFKLKKKNRNRNKVIELLIKPNLVFEIWKQQRI